MVVCCSIGVYSILCGISSGGGGGIGGSSGCYCGRAIDKL